LPSIVLLLSLLPLLLHNLTATFLLPSLSSLS
jgi:hypothetical protein